MSHGANPFDTFRRAAGFEVKILKGARPADPPIEQPTKLDLIINIKPRRRFASRFRVHCCCGRTGSSRRRRPP